MSFDLAPILLESGRIPPAQVERAVAQAAATGKGLDEVVLGLELVTEDLLADILGRHFAIPGLSLARMPRPNPRVQRLVPEEVARRHQVIPLEKAGETIILLMADPTDIVALNQVRTLAKGEVQPVVGSALTVLRALDTYYASAERRLLDSVLPFIGKLITEEAARAYKALPVDRDGSVVTVAIASADPEKTRKAIEMATGLQVRPIAAKWEDIEKALERVWRAKPPAPAAAATATPAPAAVAPAAAAPAPAVAKPLSLTPTAPPAAPAAAAAAAPMADLSAFLGGLPSSSSPAASPPPPPAGSPLAAAAAPAPGGLSLDFFASPAPPGPTAPVAAPPAAKSGNGNGALTLDAILGAGPVAVPPLPGLVAPTAALGDGAIKLDDLAAQAVPPGPNLGAAGGPEGPRTGLKVEASTRDEMKALVAKTWGELDVKLGKLVPEKVARNYRLVVTGRLEKKLFIAMENPNDRFAIETVEFISHLRVEVAPATPEQIDAGLELLYVEDEDEMAALMGDLDGFDDLDDVEMRKELEELGDLDAANAADAAPIIRLVNLIINNALKARASDIHLEVFEESLRVRYRVDGVLREVMKPPLDLRDAIISRVKIMGKMDISERRLPQDGRMRLRKGDKGKKKDIDFRISSIPTVHGEKIVMRILDKGNVRVDLTELGMEPAALEVFREAIHKPYGMCLVVGPSGSGKSNTLYSALADVNHPEVNIITCEDPVEFSTPGLNQVQARESIGLSFATALRSFLRQDPNIIFVGEIRDFETAEIAIKAALTGHLVMSTLHTNDAPACINRLTNMGVEPFLIATSLHVVVAQRLVRRICDECKERDPVSIDQLVQMGFTPEDAKSLEPMKGRGCPNCENMGYRGRTGLFEVLKVTNEMREMILYNGTATEVKKLAIAQGMRTLRMAGLQKIREGVTTCEEVVRETIG